MNTPAQEKLAELLRLGIPISEAATRAGLGLKRSYEIARRHLLPTNPTLLIGGAKLRAALVMEASGYTLEQISIFIKTAPCLAEKLLNRTRACVKQGG